MCVCVCVCMYVCVCVCILSLLDSQDTIFLPPILIHPN